MNLADLIKMAIGIALLRRGIWVRNIVTGEKIAAKSTAGGFLVVFFTVSV